MGIVVQMGVFSTCKYTKSRIFGSGTLFNVGSIL